MSSESGSERTSGDNTSKKPASSASSRRKAKVSEPDEISPLPSEGTSAEHAPSLQSHAEPYSVEVATQRDVDELVELNRIAYPQLADIDMVWQGDDVRSHLRVFPEGQVLIRDGEKIVAAASTLIVSLGRDPYRDHTWNGITDSGMFYNHNPYGDTLYGADVCVHPDYRGKGLAKLLYVARREICKKLNLRRIVLGGRLFNYCDYADQISADEYARRVEEGEIADPVLSFQLSQGFTLHKVIPNYIPDPRSLDFGSFLEWINPDYKRKPRKSRSIRVSCVQYSMRAIDDFDGFARQVSYFVDVASNYGSDFVLFPELLTAQLMSYIEVKTPIEAIRHLTELTDEVDKLFVDLATTYQIAIIGGTHPIMCEDGRIENVATMYLADGSKHRQPKLHVTPNERRWWGIDGGNTLRVIETPKVKCGILVCYDSEFPEAARYLADQGAEVIFVPFCTDDRQGYLRVRYCSQARAVENQVYVAIAGNVGNLPQTENMDIQYAQSAVFSPSDFSFGRDGILVEAGQNTETVITTDLDLEALEEAVNEGTVRQRADRRLDLFQFGTKFDAEG